jgi:hypothetical protein
MASPQSSPFGYCPYCAAERKPGQSHCWLCQSWLPTGGAAEAADLALKQIAQQPNAKHGVFQFGLSSLLLLVTLVAILCSIIKMNPGIGIVVAGLAIPALVWTMIVAIRRGQSGAPMSAFGKTGVFVLAMLLFLGVLVAVIGAFLIALFAICAAGTSKGQGALVGDPVTAIFIASAVAIAVAVICALALWKIWISSRRR